MSHKDSTGLSQAEYEAAGGRQIRILVSVISWFYFRHIRPALEILAADGHRIHVVSMDDERADFLSSILEMEQRFPNVSHGSTKIRDDAWALRALTLRQTMAWLQSFDPRFDDIFREMDLRRLECRQPKVLNRPHVTGSAFMRELAWRACSRFEAAVPPDPRAVELFKDFKPDIVMVTPLIDRGGEQMDHLRVAQALGIRTIFPVHSWDNLTSKARLPAMPDRVLVWNDIQRDEARRLHRIPDRLITVTGAQGFDEWFEHEPTLDRGEFCRQLGLDPERPILLYVASAILKRHIDPRIDQSRNELHFFERWIASIRSSDDERIRTANVILRPHPKRDRLWDGLDLSEIGPIVVHPQHGRLPNNQASKADFINSIYHSEVVFGLNTSAMIESGIIGRPVMTVLDPDYAAGQVRMQHFKYLLDVGGGLLMAAPDYAEHVRQLSAVLDDPGRAHAQARAFVEAFVRPNGLEKAAAPLFAEAVRAVALRRAPKPRHSGLLDAYLRRRMGNWTPVSQPLMSKERREKQAERERRRKEKEAQKKKHRLAKALKPGGKTGA